MRAAFIIFIFIAIMTNSNAQGLPAEVRQLSTTVESINGVKDVEVRRTLLDGLAIEDLMLPGPTADLPIAAIRRTSGGLPNENLISVFFSIDRNEAGLKALEFFSWWVRDQSRGGENVQIRSIGLPPIIQDRKQLGSTLRFSVDFFLVQPDQDMHKLLRAVGAKADALAESIQYCKAAF
jgi:hypothetical protein